MPKTPAKKPKDGQPVKLPRDVYDDLQRLLVRYPGRSLGDLAADRLRPALEAERPLLDRIRQLQDENPGKTPAELSELLIATGLDAPAKRRR